jgi:uncharacterized protein DUF4340
MKIRGLIIAVAVLAALSATLYWSEHHKPESTAQASADTPPKILSLNEADITKLDLRNAGGEDLALAKDNSGKWQMAAPRPIPVDQTVMTQILSSVSSLTSDRLLEEKAGDLKPYGLDQPALQVVITEKDNKTQKLLIGDDTPAGNAVYAKLDGDPRVFTLPSYAKNSISKNANDLRDKRLLPVEADKIIRIELIAKKQDMEFGRSKDGWQIVKPRQLRADGTQVEGLVRTLADTKMELGASDDAKKAAGAFASGTHVAIVKVTDSSGTKELQLRKKKDDYYAKSSAVDGTYKVGNQLGQELDKSLDDFRSKKLFDFGFSDPDKIELHDGSKAYLLTRSGQNWSSNGKKIDEASVTSLIDKLRDLSASKFVDSGFSAPVLDVTVVSNQGKRLEKVLIAKSSDGYIAKRENEPGQYEIDSQAFADLQKAAADLKPTTEASK